MATYTLHLPAGSAPGDPAVLDRAEVLRDGFSPWAFAAPFLWLLVHRNWLPALFALVIVLASGLGLAALGAGPGTMVAAQLLLHGLFGLEGASLRRLDLAWRGRPEVDAVAAGNAAEAETKAFARWLAPSVGGQLSAPAILPDASPVASRPVVPGVPRRGGEPIIGLFPDLEGRR